jgi:hypothetical protein
VKGGGCCCEEVANRVLNALDGSNSGIRVGRLNCVARLVGGGAVKVGMLEDEGVVEGPGFGEVVGSVTVDDILLGVNRRLEGCD